LIPTGRESGSEILRFRDDIGRHNAMDKLLGGAMVDGLFPWMERQVPSEDDAFSDPSGGFAVLTSGRISSEILGKVSKRGLPIILTKAAPTYSGIRLAREWGMTLVAFVRGFRMNVYSNPWRIIKA
jgi:FdhD protein